MIGLPFYRLLIATGLVLSGGMATAQLSHTEPKDPCENRRHVYACAILDKPQDATASRRAGDRLSVVAMAGNS